tara:strand:- start:45 stop:362 length:318 start_codon:yes stop_codon:yes gene_type:complete
MKIVDKDKRKPTNLELFFFDKEELEEMTSTDQFRSFVKEEAYEAIKYATKHNLDKAEILRLWNLGFIVTIGKKEYSNALNSILPIYESKEDYDTCSKITELINKL